MDLVCKIYVTNFKICNWSFIFSFYLIFPLRNTNFIHITINPLSANLTKWSNTIKQFVGKLPTNCLSVIDHFVRLALKGLRQCHGEFWYFYLESRKRRADKGESTKKKRKGKKELVVF